MSNWEQNWGNGLFGKGAKLRIGRIPVQTSLGAWTGFWPNFATRVPVCIRSNIGKTHRVIGAGPLIVALSWPWVSYIAFKKTCYILRDRNFFVRKRYLCYTT